VKEWEKNSGRAQRTLREEEREGGPVARARRVEGGASDVRHGVGVVEAGANRATSEQGRRGWRGPGPWGVMGPLAWVGLNEQ
jgi:hypothetical protein